MLASNGEAVVFSPRRFVFSGCLRALGTARVLLDTTMVGYFDHMVAVRLAGRFAVLEPEYAKAPDVGEELTLYDLATGRATSLAGVFWESDAGPNVYGLDSVTLDSSGFTAWRATTRPISQPLTGVSCPSASLCVAGDAAGNILSSTNPTGGPTAWSSAVVSPRQVIYGVSCPSVSLCVAVDFAVGGDVLTSTDPTGGASAWTTTTMIDRASFFDALSCPSVSLCVAGGGAGGIHAAATIATSSDPTGGASSWSSTRLASSQGIVEAVSCPSISLCVAATSSGDVYTSTNPTGGPGAWTKATIDPGGGVYAVSCPSVSLCVAGGHDAAEYSNGIILTSTNPTGGARAWTKATIDPGATYFPVGVGTLACASVSLCVAGDGYNIFTSTDPTGGASAWTRARVAQPGPDAGTVNALSCPLLSLCIVAAGDGEILSSTTPTRGATAWMATRVDIPGCASPLSPCMSEQLYARDDRGTQLLDSAPPGHGNSIANVTLAGDSRLLTWTHDREQRQIELH